MKPSRLFSYFADAVTVSVFIYLLVFPQNAAAPTREALEFCTAALIPSLFIYMALSKAVVSMPAVQRAYGYIGIAPFMLAIGALCGCPIGAKNAVTLYENGVVSKKYAEYLCSFTNNASLSFVVGYVGAQLFGDKSIGLRLFVIQLVSAVITAFVMKRLLSVEAPSKASKRSVNFRTGLREAISDSAGTMIDLCACAVFFIVAGEAICSLLRLDGLANTAIKAVLEFSSGCAATAKSGGYAVALTAFTIGFGGCSVALQVRSIVAGKLSIKPFLAGKTIQAAVMTLLTVIFG